MCEAAALSTMNIPTTPSTGLNLSGVEKHLESLGDSPTMLSSAIHHQGFVKNIYQLIGELSEKVKCITRDTQQITPLATDISEMRKEMREKLSGLSSRILTNETDIKDLGQLVHNKSLSIAEKS